MLFVQIAVKEESRVLMFECEEIDHQNFIQKEEIDEMSKFADFNLIGDPEKVDIVRPSTYSRIILRSNKGTDKVIVTNRPMYIVGDTGKTVQVFNN